MAESRKRLLVSNILVFGLGNVTAKAFTIVLLPVLARLIADPAVFGVVDLVVVVSSLLVPLGNMGMQDAAFREYFDTENPEERQQVLDTARVITVVSTAWFGALLILFRRPIAALAFSDATMARLVFVSAAMLAAESAISIYARPHRLDNRKAQYVFINLLSVVVSYAIAIPMVVYVDPLLGLFCLRGGAELVKVCAFYVINRSRYTLRLIDRESAKRLLSIGVPLLPTYLVYWVFRSMDRVMITHLMDVGATGIYGLGARLASIGLLISSAFSQGWAYFAFKTMRDEDQIRVTGRIANAWIAVITLGFVVVSWATPLVWRLLFPPTFAGGDTVVPYLMIAPLMLSLFQVVSTQFLILRKSYIVSLVLLVGALTNLTLNYVLIPRLGIVGAAVATAVGYAVAVAIAVVVATKLHAIRLPVKSAVAIVGAVLVAVGNGSFMESTAIRLILTTLFAVSFWLSFREMLHEVLATIRNGSGRQDSAV